MLLTISTTASPASDLGFLLHKHPDKVQVFEQAFGTAHVFYPEASAERCTAALLLEVDPIALVRAKGKSTPDFTLGQYVNDRPYAASSLLASAMAGVFRTAMRGRCDLRQDLADSAIPLEINLPALPCKGGLEGLFEPLGWEVEAVPVPLDAAFPEWGDSRYVTLTLRGTMKLSDALNQLYVLLPVLDDSKHYWLAPDEVDKLIRAGEGWLADHPRLDRITRRYLSNRRGLIRTALSRLIEEDEDQGQEEVIEEEAPRSLPLNELRHEAVLAALKQEEARSVIDLGCGSGKLVGKLLKDRDFARITGADVSYQAIMIARRRLKVDRMPPAQAARLELFQGALTYTDDRFKGYDAAVLMEVIEHVDPPRLPAVSRVVFGDARPRVVVVTTPNIEHNTRYEGLTGLRHPDHRFEWTRQEFQDWASGVAAKYGYAVRYAPVGDDDPEVGPPTQMGVFTR